MDHSKDHECKGITPRADVPYCRSFHNSLSENSITRKEKDMNIKFTGFCSGSRLQSETLGRLGALGERSRNGRERHGSPARGIPSFLHAIRAGSFSFLFSFSFFRCLCVFTRTPLRRPFGAVAWCEPHGHPRVVEPNKTCPLPPSSFYWAFN